MLSSLGATVDFDAVKRQLLKRFQMTAERVRLQAAGGQHHPAELVQRAVQEAGYIGSGSAAELCGNWSPVDESVPGNAPVGAPPGKVTNLTGNYGF